MRKLLLALFLAIPVAAQYPTTSYTAGGNITAASSSCLVTNCVPIKLPASATVLTVGVTGTFSATLAVEESQDGGTTWTSAGSSITSAGTSSFTITAFSDFRVRASAYVSGNAGVNILVSASTTSGGSGVSSLNSLSGAVTLAAGTNVTVTPSGNTLTIASSGGGGSLSGMTAGQVPIAATASTVTSSKALAGSGAGITTGPTTSVSGDAVSYTGTSGQTADSGLAMPAAVGNATVTQTIANGTATLGTSSITSGTCATVVTVAGTGIVTTDNIQADFNADPTSTVGYAASVNGTLTIVKYPTSGNVNFKVCNNTASPIVPGAVTLNWRVVR